MFEMIAQIWGGGFYLANKILFARSERCSAEKKKFYSVLAWCLYLLGLPAWVLIFVEEGNWMAAAVETGGAISMILGLFVALKGRTNIPKWLNNIALYCAVAGIGFSLSQSGANISVNQLLEFGVVIGFLLGNYLLAKENKSGYYFFALMNTANASLMYIQSYPWLTLQQLISLFFIIDAILKTRLKPSIIIENDTLNPT